RRTVRLAQRKQTLAQGSRPSPSWSSYIESKMHDVAVLHDVFLAFERTCPLRARRLAVAGGKVSPLNGHWGAQPGVYYAAALPPAMMQINPAVRDSIRRTAQFFPARAS